jgi:hypothetical protein
MDVSEWDFFEEEVATLVLEFSLTFPNAIGEACRRNLAKSADAMLLGAISFVTNWDGNFETDNGLGLIQSRQQYRILAALATDVALLSPNSRECADLIQFWQLTSDPIFC